MYRKILVAHDGSPGAFAALTAGLDLAAKLNAEIHMISVTELPTFPGTMDEVIAEQDEGSRRLQPVIERARQLAAFKGLTIEAHLLPGHPVKVITDFVRDHGFDLLVVGFMGHSALYNSLIGSTTDRLVNHAPSAVLVIK
ncbi:MAG TPA: universal stress protein [Xanthobacteraceae bacterium]|jgi:nucleotide-binding universal stress UspA family protein